MGKKRVYELARELGLPSKIFIERAQALGYTWIQSHANTLEGNEATELAQKLSEGGGQTQTRRRSTVLRRRARPTDGKYEMVTTRISESGAEVIERKRIEMTVPAPFMPVLEAPEPTLEEPVEATPEVAVPEVGVSVSRTEAPAEAVVEEPAGSEIVETKRVEPAAAAAAETEADVQVAEPVEAVEASTPTEVIEPVAPAVSEAPEKEVQSVAEPVAAVEKTPEVAEPQTAPEAPSSAGEKESLVTAENIGEPVQNQSVSSLNTSEPTIDTTKASTIVRIEKDKRLLGDEDLLVAPEPPRADFGDRNDRRNNQRKETRAPGTSEGEGRQRGKGRRKGTRQEGADEFGRTAGRGRRARREEAGSRSTTKPPKKRGKKGDSQPTTAPMSAKKRVIKIDGAITVAELAHRMGVKAAELIGALLRQGVMARINDVLSLEQAESLAKSKNYEVRDTSVAVEDILQREEQVEDPEALVPRPPVVTVMGHVDHGKTSLLDAIRETRVADQEAGGITQHIGASVVTLKDGRDIVFLDTPGHEAFTAMRSRGAQSTDIVILVVAADDSVMPQTIEAISHAQAAGVPIVVAVNKIDKAGADPTRVRTDLMQYNLLPEEYGGDTLIVNVSAHTRQGIPELLESVLLQAEIMELRANPNRLAQGIVVESRIEKGRGPVATVLVQSGTLRAGDAIVAGVDHGRIRAMFDHNNQSVKEAMPSMPVKILGLSGTPAPGDVFDCVEDEKAARQVADLRIEELKKKEMASPQKASLQDLWGAAQKKELNVILKTDVEGTLEALKQSLLKLRNDEIELTIRHAAVGGITENDINLASTTGCVVFGFNVRADNKAQKLAESEGIEIRTYQVIYELLDDVKAAMERQLAPTLQEKPIGQAEIRKIFSIPKVGKVAGCYVTEGKITRGSLIRLYRDNIRIYEGKVSTLRRFKNDVKEVASGYECGIQIEGYQEIHENDIIEAYEIEEIATKLELNA